MLEIQVEQANGDPGIVLESAFEQYSVSFHSGAEVEGAEAGREGESEGAAIGAEGRAEEEGFEL